MRSQAQPTDDYVEDGQVATDGSDDHQVDDDIHSHHASGWAPSIVARLRQVAGYQLFPRH